jgi:hypothetical protein
MNFISDIATKSWSREETDEDSFSVSIYVGFRNNGLLPVIFNDMTFGYSLKKNNQIISTNENPPDGIVYISSDQDYISSYTVSDLIPDEEYTIEVWSKNSGEIWEESFNFTLPRPTSPYNSWIYDEENYTWNPPIPQPNDENVYTWNEEDQQWDIVEQS